MRILLVLTLLFVPLGAIAESKFIILASTTSTQNSGLYDYLLPIFTAKTGIEVRVVAVGTGQALKIAQNGDADVLIVHHRPSEDAFVKDGHGIDRKDLMYNDFVIVGPNPDQGGFHNFGDLLSTFAYTGAYPFISRGDDSGTYKKEQELWLKFTDGTPAGPWYREIGAGMGAALNMASSLNAYTLSDRGTWLSFGNKGNLGIVWEGEQELFNPYGLILVNPEKHPHVKIDAARVFSDWMVSKEGQAAIAAFTIDNMQLFCPNAELYKDLLKNCPSTVPLENTNR